MRNSHSSGFHEREGGHARGGGGGGKYIDDISAKHAAEDEGGEESVPPPPTNCDEVWRRRSWRHLWRRKKAVTFGARKDLVAASKALNGITQEPFLDS